MHENRKMRHVETVPGMEGREIKNDGGVNLTEIYCKHFCKCQCTPSTIIR
jgi:hypothetical protein